MRCKICNGQSERIFAGTVLKKYQVDYCKCAQCGFIQTEDPYWLDEAYSNVISDRDLGPVNRAIIGSRNVEAVILTCFDANAKFVDWGGGYGLFTRLMRDNGYDYYWHDIYCQNLFAKGFVAAPGTRYELLTAFEVFEHLVDPHAEVSKMLEYSQNIMFSTVLVPGEVASTKDWQYFSPANGQHVAFYTIAALRHVASRYGLHLCSDGAELHLLSERPVSERLFKTIARNWRTAAMIRRVLRRKLRHRTLLWKDFEAANADNV